MMLVRGLATAIGVVVLDQLSKAAVRGYFAGHAAGGQENVTSFFNIVLIHTRGMSFGLFNGGGGLNAPLFSHVAAAIVTVLIYWLSRVGSPLLATAIAVARPRTSIITRPPAHCSDRRPRRNAGTDRRGTRPGRLRVEPSNSARSDRLTPATRVRRFRRYREA